MCEYVGEEYDDIYIDSFRQFNTFIKVHTLRKKMGKHSLDLKCLNQKINTDGEKKVSPNLDFKSVTRI